MRTIVCRSSRFEVERCAILLRVFGDVDQYGAGAAAGRNLKGFAQRRSNVLRTCHEIVMFGDGQSNAGDVYLLKRIGAQNL